MTAAGFPAFPPLSRMRGRFRPDRVVTAGSSSALRSIFPGLGAQAGQHDTAGYCCPIFSLMPAACAKNHEAQPWPVRRAASMFAGRLALFSFAPGART